MNTTAHDAQPTASEDVDVVRLIDDDVPPRRRVCYDSLQAGAVLLSWRCCRRTVYATHPQHGCPRCPK